MAQGTGVLAAVTTERQQAGIVWGGVPCFWARDDQEQQAIALTLAAVLDAMVHVLPNGILIVVRH